MSAHTHQTAPTQFVEANGVRFAYRRFGKTGGVPLVFNQHFMGTMDHWDPAVTDGFARKRDVILFNNAGVCSSSGEVPTSFEQMGGNAIVFVKALGLQQVDVLDFSLTPIRSARFARSWTSAAAGQPIGGAVANLKCLWFAAVQTEIPSSVTEGVGCLILQNLSLPLGPKFLEIS